jgi:heme-degrading monooxygenase HmoA
MDASFAGRPEISGIIYHRGESMSTTRNTPEFVSDSKIERAGFVAINYIYCQPHYQDRFEQLFASRVRAIDRMPGFLFMEVLKPHKEGEYLIMSHWENEKYFRAWTRSPEFLEGHQRGFADIKAAKERGEQPPMTSDFRTYSIISR